MEASASLAFRTNNAGMIRLVTRGRHIKAADVAEIVEVAKIVGSAEIFRKCRRRMISFADKPNDEAFPTPKFNVMTIAKALGLVDCLGIVGTGSIDPGSLGSKMVPLDISSEEDGQWLKNYI